MHEARRLRDVAKERVDYRVQRELVREHAGHREMVEERLERDGNRVVRERW